MISVIAYVYWYTSEFCHAFVVSITKAQLAARRRAEAYRIETILENRRGKHPNKILVRTSTALVIYEILRSIKYTIQTQQMLSPSLHQVRLMYVRILYKVAKVSRQ